MHTAHDKTLQKKSDKDYRTLLITLEVEEHLLQEIKDGDLEILYQRLHLAMYWIHLRYEPLQCNARWQIEVLSGQGEYYKNIIFYDNLRDNWGSTPLHYAVWHGSKEVFEWIDKQPPEYIELLLGLKDKAGRTLFHYAAWSGTEEAFAWMDRHPKEVLELRDNDERTPIHFAAWSGTKEAFGWISTLSYLDLTLLVDYAKGTPLHYAAMSIMGLEWIKREHQDTIDLYNPVSRTLFHWGASTGNIEILDWLFSNYKSKLDTSLFDHVTPLHYAAASGATEVFDWIDVHFSNTFETNLSLFIAVALAGAEGLQWIKLHHEEALKIKDVDGRTCFHHAVFSGNKAAIDWIIAYQKEALLLQDNFGKTPVHYAGMNGNPEVLNHALMLSPNPNSLTLCNSISAKFLSTLVLALKTNHTLTRVDWSLKLIEKNLDLYIEVSDALRKNIEIKRDKVRFIFFMQGVIHSNSTVSLLNFSDLGLCNSILRHLLPKEIESSSISSIFEEIKNRTINNNKQSRVLTIINQEIERLEVSNNENHTFFGYSINTEYKTSAPKIASLQDLKNKIEANPDDLTSHVTIWEMQSQAIFASLRVNRFSFFGCGLNKTQKMVQNIMRIVGSEQTNEPPQEDLMDESGTVLLY
jgi:ankyrin repeat protein